MKIVCVGRNYVEHIKELNNDFPKEPVYFIKPSSCISQKIKIPDYATMHYEGEICFLIKNKRIDKVGFGFDFTLREIQSLLKEKGLPWERAKAFKNSAVFSDFVAYSGDIDDLRIKVYKNNILVQDASANLMIYKPSFLIKDIDKIFGLDDGDILMSGTPKGVGKVNKGDTFTSQILSKDTLLIEKSFIV